MWDPVQKLEYRVRAGMDGAQQELNMRLTDRRELPLTGLNGEKLYLTGAAALRKKAAELDRLYEQLPSHRGVKDTLLLDAWSSATIEGARTTVQRVLDHFKDPGTKDDRMVINTIAGSRFAFNDPITEKNIRKLWEMIVDGVCKNEEKQGALYRDGMVYVGSGDRIIHVPARPDQLQEQMAQWFTYRENTEADLLINSFAAHFYFVYLHPFCDGNGRTARILNASQLYHGGYRKMKQLPLSNAVNNQLSGYYSSLSDSETVLNGSKEKWLLYILLFIRKRPLCALVSMLSMLFAQTLTKGLIAFSCNMLGIDTGLPEIDVLNELLFYGAMVLLAVFYRKHPLKVRCELPGRYWVLMTLLPLASYFPVRIYLQSFGKPETFIAPGPSSIMVTITVLEMFVIISLYYLSVMLIRAYDDYTETSAVNQRMSLQLDHVERSSAMVEQIRADRHELKNIFFYLNSLADADRIDELKKFCSEHLAHRYDRLEEFNTGNELTDYLLTQKVSEAREAGIHVMADVLLPPSLPVADADICSLLVNLLDNAIDAEKKELCGDIQLRLAVHKNYLTMTVRNRVSVDVLKDNPNLKTTKTDMGNHGIGTRVVRSICKKYNGLVDYHMENGYFVADAMLELADL